MITLTRASELALLALAVVVMAGCASAPSAPVAGPAAIPAVPPEASTPANSQPTPIQAVLRDQARKWQGVDYQWGGLDRDGIDCSGLVYLTFRSRFGVDVPRTTAALSRQGRRIARRDLRPGDLVFFKTGRNQRHVGIYMGQDRFLHASSRTGVRISSLNNVYWRRHFWEARRIPVAPAPDSGSATAPRY